MVERTFAWSAVDVIAALIWAAIMGAVGGLSAWVNIRRYF